MDNLRSKLEALLARDMYMNNSYRPSNTPLLSEGLEMLTIETPAKLKNLQAPLNRAQSCLPPRPQAPSVPFPRPRTNFGCIFSDPTPLRLISDSPLITPSRFHN